MELVGKLDGKMAQELVASLKKDDLNFLDFSKITDINFAALRALLNARKGGARFTVLNACDIVAEKFEDSGVSSFVSVCRNPKPLEINKYEEFGKSYLSVAFNSKDGDSMIKVYGANVPRWVAAQEKCVAKAVMTFGINTPLVGRMYVDGDKTGLDFERIEGKRSFSRIISEEPERLEEMSRRFARMCKKLHETPCDTNIFNDKTVLYRRVISTTTEFTEDERAKVLAFLDSIPKATTCLHGDMQVSNVITNGKEDLWIDLSDFAYGNPMFDMAMWYFLSNLHPEELCLNLFHVSKDKMKQIWDIFIDEYFGAHTAAQKAEVVAKVEPFTAMHLIYLGTLYGFEPFMIDYVREHLLNK